MSVIDRTSTEFKAYLELYERASLLELGQLADAERWRQHPENVVTYIIDRNINYTNVCVADCKFCAFYRRPRHAEGYVLSFEEIGAKIDECKALGGGGEILVDEIRERVARKKAQTEEWLGVQEEAHHQGMKTSVTMMYGLGESNEDRIEHLLRIRELQARTGGFTAFICWPLQPEGTEMADQTKTDAVTYLRTLAMARIICSNVPNLQSSWVTM